MADIPATPYRTFDRTVLVGPEAGFRPGTVLRTVPINFFFNDAGMGDFICFSSAIIWIAEHCPWVAGRLYCSAFLVPLLRCFLEPYPNFKVIPGEKIQLDVTECAYGPNLEVNGIRQFQQLLNPMGAHLVDLGFAYYTNSSHAPPGVTYPQLRTDPKTLPRELRGKEGSYVVLTPGAPTTSRTLAARHLNPVIDALVDVGLLPVFLGRSVVTSTHSASFPDGVAYGRGLDLREKTTLLEAACVMEHSLCTLGLDNGLLHLAATTTGTVLFGYNIASPEHRRPRRPPELDSRTIDVVVPEAQLPCRHCQSNMKMHVTHSFHQCVYGDLRCIDLLFRDEGAEWRQHIMRLKAERETK